MPPPLPGPQPLLGCPRTRARRSCPKPPGFRHLRLVVVSDADSWPSASINGPCEGGITLA